MTLNLYLDIEMIYPRNDKRFQRFLFFGAANKNSDAQTGDKNSRALAMTLEKMTKDDKSTLTSVNVLINRFIFFPSLYFVQDTAVCHPHLFFLSPIFWNGHVRHTIESNTLRSHIRF